MKRTNPFRAAALLAAGVLASADPAHAQQFYELEIVGFEGQTIGGKAVDSIDGIDLSDNGLVAFAGRSGTDNVVWNSTTVLAATGELYGGVTLPNFLANTVQINNNGDVAVVNYSSFFPSNPDSGVYTASGKVGGFGAVIDGQTLTGTVGLGLFLGNDGTVYFYNEIDDGRQGLFTQNELLLADNDAVSGIPVNLDAAFGQFEGIDVDERGNAYLVFVDGPGGLRSIIRPNTFVLADGDTLGGTSVTQINTSDFAVSDSGLLAFVDNAPSTPVFVFGGSSDGVVFDATSTIDGVTVGSIFDLDINNDGTLAFYGGFGGSGDVFTQDELVLGVGETLEGLTFLGSASIGQNIVINDLGQIAFVGRFEDSTGNRFDAAVLATLVPEPTSLTLLLCGVSALSVRRRRAT